MGLDEIPRSALGALALLTLGQVFYLAVLEQGLHLNFAAAGAIKALRGARRTRVLGNLGHRRLLMRVLKIPNPPFFVNRAVCPSPWAWQLGAKSEKVFRKKELPGKEEDPGSMATKKELQ
jgi:hypothetical protein